MKKLFAVLLTAALLLSLAACGEDSAYSVYNKVNSNMDSVTSLEMDTYVSATISMMGETLDMTMDGVTRQVYLSDTELEQEMVLTMYMMGMTYDAVSYYKDGYMYQQITGEMMGTPIDQRIKMKVDIADIVEQSNTQLVTFNTQAVKESSINELADGSRELTFVLDGEALSDSLIPMVADLYEQIGLSSAGLTFSDVSFSMVADSDDMMSGMKMAFGMDMSADGIDVGMSFSIEGDVLSYNTLTGISFPSDLDTYVEA